MKKQLITILVVILSITYFVSCQEDNLPNKEISVLDTSTEIKNDFDRYLQKEFVEKYNVRINYRLSKIELDQSNFVVPTSYEKSVQMSNLLKYLCFEPFDKIAPKNFMKTYFPKELILIGSGAFRNNNTVILGTAEAGKKISLFAVNNLDFSDKERLFSRYFRTIFHEFAHIWHQTIPFTADFDQITATTYTGDAWSEAWKDGESLIAGYVSDYASNSNYEDFVELIAHYTTFSPEKWDKMVTDAGPIGGEIISRKITIVKNYLLDSWSLNIDELRDEILLRASKLNEQDFDKIN